jgi:hypothetical protein
MLTMDQILASNELTMAATAAMPAMVRHIPFWFKFRLFSLTFSSSTFFSVFSTFFFSVHSPLSLLLIHSPYTISHWIMPCNVLSLYLFYNVIILFTGAFAVMQSITVLFGIRYLIKHSFGDKHEKMNY